MISNKFLGVSAMALLLACSGYTETYAQTSYESKRPEIAKRNFSSEAVEKMIVEVRDAISDPKLRWMFEIVSRIRWIRRWSFV